MWIGSWRPGLSELKQSNSSESAKQRFEGSWQFEIGIALCRSLAVPTL